MLWNIVGEKNWSEKNLKSELDLILNLKLIWIRVVTIYDNLFIQI
jgi:hypothetical protein